MSKNLNIVLGMMEPLGEAAEAAARASVQAFTPPKRERSGLTLRPGPDTPLWNEVVAAVEPLLAGHGEKANLGRILGVPRQRIHDYFVSRKACPDAERVLLILQWLKAKSLRPPPSSEA